jgi:hypothetical protein
MDFLSSSLPDQGPRTADPRLQPTPDYGKLGPGADVSAGPDTTGGSAPQSASSTHIGPLIAIGLGVFLAVLAGSAGSARAAWERFASGLSSHSNAPINAPTISSRKDFAQLDRLKPQKQAEKLLELAIGNTDGAADQISSRADRWRGKLKWDSQLAALATAALNSRDLGVRESGIEVQLSAYGLAKNSTGVDSLVLEAGSSDHARRIWALWTLGLMANRGIETDRIVEVLTSHLKDSDEESRRWAVEGLALVGTTPTIMPLLRTLHDDPSPRVRERAACSLAESGMLTREQRLTAVPQLVTYSNDPSLDAQTHAWAFQALGDITKQRLPNDSNAWRDWYENNRVGN